MQAAHRRYYWLLLPLLAVILVVLLWDWNWFKPLLERRATAAIGRSVQIGDLDVALSSQPLIRLEAITVANPESFADDPAPFASVERIHLRLGLRELFRNQLRIISLEIEKPQGSLRTGPNNSRNWQFTLPQRDPDADPWQLAVEQLSIRDGQFKFVDASQKADLTALLHTEDAANGQEPILKAKAEGRYHDQPFKAQFTGGSILSLRSPENPYPVDFTAESGATRIALKGSLLDPLQFAGARLRLMLQGKNLGALYAFVSLPLPNTPPYKLEGDLDYSARRIHFRNVKGLMGESDLAGNISVLLRHPRPLLEATLRSKQVRLADLTGLIGGKPNQEGKVVRADGRVLPNTPVSLPKLQSADARLDFVGEHIIGEKTPFDRLSLKLSVDNSVLRVAPADFGVGEGQLRVYATLDPRGEKLALDAKAELQRLDVARLMASSRYKGSGRLGGYASLKGSGRSAAELMAHGNGELKLAMAGGDFSSLLLDLSGLDFGNALISALSINKRTEVRCLVGDFELKDGVLDTKSFVLDTGNTNLLLNGSANLRDETLALDIRTRPKRANIGRLKAPIHVGGSFANPRIRPDYVDIGLRAGAAIALGTLFTPLVALLPTLQLSPGEDRDCKALLAAAEVKAPKMGSKP